VNLRLSFNRGGVDFYMCRFKMPAVNKVSKN
jgi:hypothetical protein